MSDITETQNLFFSAFGQIPDEFKPIVLLSLAGLLIISYYLWKTNNGLISCIRKVIHKDEKLSSSTDINQYEIEIITIKQELDDMATDNNIIKNEIDGVKNEILKVRSNIERINSATESASSVVKSVREIIDLIYKQNSDLLVKTQNSISKDDIYELYKDLSNMKLLLEQMNNMMMAMRIESSKNTDGISILNTRIQNIENSLTITSKNSFR